jgi:hypothetical protein
VLLLVDKQHFRRRRAGIDKPFVRNWRVRTSGASNRDHESTANFVALDASADRAAATLARYVQAASGASVISAVGSSLAFSR